MRAAANRRFALLFHSPRLVVELFTLGGIAFEPKHTKISPMQTGQNRYSRSPVAICVLALVYLAASSYQGRAAVSNYLSFATFEAAVGPQPLIRFTEIPLGTAPTDEYASLGVQFL